MTGLVKQHNNSSRAQTAPDLCLDCTRRCKEGAAEWEGGLDQRAGRYEGG